MVIFPLSYTRISARLRSRKRADKKAAQRLAEMTNELRKEIALRDFTQWADAIRRESTKEAA